MKTVIVTGASQGIGAGVANLFLERGYNVVANSRNITGRNELSRSDQLALVDGDIGAVARAFGVERKNGSKLALPGVMSRKKQVAPKLLSVL